MFGRAHSRARSITNSIPETIQQTILRLACPHLSFQTLIIVIIIIMLYKRKRVELVSHVKEYKLGQHDCRIYIIL